MMYTRYFLFRFGMPNAIDNHLRLNFRIVCGGNCLLNFFSFGSCVVNSNRLFCSQKLVCTVRTKAFVLKHGIQ